MDAKELVRIFFQEVFTKGLLDGCGAIMAPVYVEHAVAPFSSEEPGSVEGPQHLITAAYCHLAARGAGLDAGEGCAAPADQPQVAMVKGTTPT
jgi:hypothetical protein